MISRVTPIRGPGRVVFNSASFFSKDDFSVAINTKTFDLRTSAHGITDTRDEDQELKLSFAPDGRLNSTIISALWPYASSAPGDKLMSATDVPLYIHTAESHLHTVLAAAVWKMPDIILSATETQIGQIEFIGLRANGEEYATDSKVYIAATSGGTFTDTNFATSGIVTQAYTSVFGAVTGLTSFESENGFQVSFDLQWEPEKIDSAGILNYRFKDLVVRCRCIPVGPTADDILDAIRVQGTGAGRGKSRSNIAADLTITGADTTTIITLKKMTLNQGQFAFGPTPLRTGEVEFVSTRYFSSGVPGARFTIAVA